MSTPPGSPLFRNFDAIECQRHCNTAKFRSSDKFLSSPTLVLTLENYRIAKFKVVIPYHPTPPISTLRDKFRSRLKNLMTKSKNRTSKLKPGCTRSKSRNTCKSGQLQFSLLPPPTLASIIRLFEDLPHIPATRCMHRERVHTRTHTRENKKPKKRIGKR